MNKLTILFTILLIPAIAFGQKPKVKNDPNHDDQPIHFGFSLGLNFMDYRIELSEEAMQLGLTPGVTKLSPGINIHAIANLRLGNRWDLRSLPGISFGERSITFYGGEDTELEVVEYLSNSAYVEIPLTLKYKSKRLNNFRPYLLSGANFRIDLANKGSYDREKQLLMIRKFDVYGELGFGLDFYMEYFKFGVELKYSFGLMDIMQRLNSDGDLPSDYAPYTNSIDHLYSQMVVLLFNFE